MPKKLVAILDLREMLKESLLSGEVLANGLVTMERFDAWREVIDDYLADLEADYVEPEEEDES